MAVKRDGKDIYLTVRDLMGPADNDERLVASIPLPQRGKMGRQAQTYLQHSHRLQKSLFVSESIVNRSYSFRDARFHISGRVDGLYKLKERLELEEIKSVVLQPAEFNKLHAGSYPRFNNQLLFYAYLLQDMNDGCEVVPYLRLFNLIDDREKVFKLDYKRQEVERALLKRFEQIYALSAERQKSNLRRSRLAQTLNFDLPDKRAPQEEMMRRVDEGLEQGRRMMVSAPTGTGKTAGALIPFLKKALKTGQKIFFATSRTDQQNQVLETLRRIDPDEKVFRSYIVSSAARMCANPIYFCHESFCPFIENFTKRLEQSALLEKLNAQKSLNREDVYNAGVEKKLCPLEVNNKLLKHFDVLVGDVNYVFDPMASRKNLFGREGFDEWLLIIDEAHGLLERGRAYLSVEVGRGEVDALQLNVSLKDGRVYGKLAAALELWQKLFDGWEQEGRLHHERQSDYAFDVDVLTLLETFRVYEAAYIAYVMHKVRKNIILPDDPLENLYYRLRRLAFILRQEDVPLKALYETRKGGLFRIICLDASHYLANRMERFANVLAMSATLDPLDYFEKMLGFPPGETERVFIPSAFPPHHKKVIIVPGVSTRYKDRGASWPRVAAVIKETAALRRGNYLVFFPSFDYMRNVYLFMGNTTQDILMQRPGMEQNEREEIMELLREKGSARILLAVLGGGFAEGIDFSGDMAIGVIIVGPGLPPFNHERELMREYYDNLYGEGEAYAYRYPAGQKIIQAAGRLIRTHTDRGIIVLIGDRFKEESYNALLPDYWFDRPGDVVISENYEREIAEFWNRK